ncbi:hypothetical protein Tco_0029910, partial [Tanacetum coccineum]
DTYEIYVKLDDAQSDRSLMAGQLNVLRMDRRYHTNTVLLVERQDRVAPEACAQSMDASHRARSEVMTLHTTVSTLQIENGELRAADCRRQTQLLEALTQKMPLRRAPRTRTTPATTIATTPFTDAAIRALIS